MIDDDAGMAELLSRALAREGFSLTAAETGEDGLAYVDRSTPDLVLLDVTLPGINGLEVLRRLRRQSDLPVIMLSARGEEVDRIVGLEVGADDYLPKPFSVRELVARMNAILRRTVKARQESADGTPPARREIRHGAVQMDLLSRTARCESRVLPLTTSEFELLRVLMESAGRPVPREQLSKLVLDREYAVLDRGIDNLVSSLRRKLGATPEGLERIKSIRHVGYLFADLGAADI